MHRFRHIDDKQLIGLYLYMQAVSAGKQGVHLNNDCLCSIIGVKAVHDSRLKDLANSFRPFFVTHKPITYSGEAKGASFYILDNKELPTTDITHIPSIPEIEKMLGIHIREIETEIVHLRTVKKANF